jgi:hypothetical protein
MPIIVVSGSGRNVGKTSLVCGLIAALGEYSWRAVKITSHVHKTLQPIWQETARGQGSDTARYLAAGAERAFLISTSNAELPCRLQELQSGPEGLRNWIFESNRILDVLRPDLCLAVLGKDRTESKPSFVRIASRVDATVVGGQRDQMTGGARVRFELVDLTKVPLKMQQWIRARLALGGSL